MKKLFVAVMSLGLFAVAAPVAAQDARLPGGDDVQAAVIHANKKQTKVTIDQNVLTYAIPANTYVPIDAAKTLNCGTTTCVISADITYQLQRGSAVDTFVVFRFIVDGVEVQGSNFFADLLNHNGYQFVTQSMVTNQLGPGNHTVQTFVFVSSASNHNGAFHNVKYAQYKP